MASRISNPFFTLSKPSSSPWGSLTIAYLSEAAETSEWERVTRLEKEDMISKASEVILEKTDESQGKRKKE